MKNNIITLLALFAALLATSCSDMLDTSSDNVAYEKDHKLNDANDSIYSIMGVLAKVQNIADRVVINGELRGDLATVNPSYASTSLQAIESFTADANNAYAGRRDFYDVINNCNYIIAHIDTTITQGQTQVMRPEYAQAKVIRAWTYLQMGLIFGRANYFTAPLVSLADSSNVGTTLTLDQLVPRLISDLSPIAGERALNYGTVDGWNSAEFFIPAQLLLGDLYLYANDYANAAQSYYNAIYNRSLTVSSSYANTWESPLRANLSSGHLNAYLNEVITRVVFDSELRSNHSQMLKLTYSDTPSILPAQAFVAAMNGRTHFHTDNQQGISRYFNGDMRGQCMFANGNIVADTFGTVAVGKASSCQTLITKFFNNLSGSTTDELRNRPLTSLAIYRPSLVYLRYAEAINRLGKPTLAFAVLKYGLSRNTLSDTLRVDSNEVRDLPAYIDFTDSRFDGNVGTAARGLGLGVSLDRDRYVIPAGVDTTAYVEEAILEEMAAETCFEGNRFFDLLCVSRHRDDFPRFMAEKVSAKYDNAAAMLTKLMDINKWFIK